MASNIVIDSGILISSVFAETLTPQAKLILRYWHKQDTHLIAPALFRYEIVAVSRKAAFQGRVTPAESSISRDYMLSYPVETYLDDDLLKRAHELATEHNRPTAYDSQYLAVAERFNCDFWTADEKLYNAVSNKLKWVNWLGNFVEPS